MSAHKVVTWWFVSTLFSVFFFPISPFQRLSCASEGMKLSAATLRNLEILNNQVKAHPKHLRLACSAQVHQHSVKPMFFSPRAAGRQTVG